MSPQIEKLLSILIGLNKHFYGEVRIIIEDGRFIRIEKKESHKL